MVLGTNQEMFVMPDPGEAQLEASYRSVDRGSAEEPDDSPVIGDTDREIGPQLFGGRYYIIEPLSDKRDAAYESIAYPSESYVPVRLTREGKACTGEQIVYTGSIPLTSPQGTLVVNGIDRVTINQILRSPGTYHNLERGSDGNPMYAGTTIPNRGGKSKPELDGRNRIWVRVRKKRKTPIQPLSLAMGSSMKEILENTCYPETSGGATRENEAWSGEHAVPESCKSLYGTDEYPELSDTFEELRQKFFQPRFEIGEIGRTDSNKKPDLDVSKNEIFPLPRDMSAAIDYSIGTGVGVGNLDDMDHPKNRRIRTVADSLQDQSRLASERLADPVRGGVSKAARRKNVPTTRGVVNSSPLLTTLKESSGSHPLSQSSDQTNPLTQMVHKRKPSSPGPGGLARRTASSRMRDIHPSHYGRACPIETSEGMNAGLISSLALHAGVNHWGYLTSPFCRISGVSSEGNDIVAHVSAADEGYRIATGTCLSVYRRDRGRQTAAAWYRQESVTLAWNQIHLRSIPPLQNFPAGAPLTPSLENNDANRTPMGSNMQRQAAPLLRPEQRFVGTGLEGQVALDSGDAATATRGGRIDYIGGGGTTLASDGETVDTKSIMYQSSNNNNTCVHQRSKGFGNGGFLRKGQIIADGRATEGGELALGRNILMAYMPWEGYNSEDPVPISERLTFGDTYTSIHTERYEAGARVTLQGTAEIITRKTPHSDDYFPRHSDESGPVPPGSWVETGDVSAGKPAPRNPEELPKAPGSNLPQAIPGIDITTAKETRPRVPTGGRGRIIDVRWIYPGDTSKYTRVVRVYVLQARETQVGDKVAGRHGNKGITSKIAPRQDMPYLQDGTSIDTIPSPPGVPSRMNVGQILERVLGLAGHHPGRHHRIIPFDEGYEREAPRKLVFSETYEASKRTANPWLFELGNPGKSQPIDGRTGEAFEQPVTVGKAHILKPVHQVDKKIHARSGGPHSRVTQQPLKGKSKQGGQRVGETEVRALEGFGVSHTLREMLTTKSDHVQARREMIGTVAAGEPIYGPGTITPEPFRSPVRELRRLAPDSDPAITERNLVFNNGSREGGTIR
uniref:DNA-directed RNA polymerase subunit beta n=1 Tax=Selaginella tamariscina TaxID=137178 RepID=A0A482CNR1_9TRAC|nr:RNA polymerase beta subunit [Selaginella tamariscina]QBL76381.1 RNA polymerase beta subunit [Selaginella tamariscina]